MCDGARGLMATVAAVAAFVLISGCTGGSTRPADTSPSGLGTTATTGTPAPSTSNSSARSVGSAFTAACPLVLDAEVADVFGMAGEKGKESNPDVQGDFRQYACQFATDYSQLDIVVDVAPAGIQPIEAWVQERMRTAQDVVAVPVGDAAEMGNAGVGHVVMAIGKRVGNELRLFYLSFIDAVERPSVATLSEKLRAFGLRVAGRL